MKLAEYLAQLNSSETQWGVYVNPRNIDEYRIGQDCFENGGFNDDFVCIGCLESLSYGFQSDSEAIKSMFKYGHLVVGDRVLELKNINLDGIIEAYYEDRLSPEFANALKEEIESMHKEWSQNAAEAKVEGLEEYSLKAVNIGKS